MRLIAFSHFAGIVGTVESLLAMGKRFSEGFKTIFTRLKQPYQYHNLEQLKETIKNLVQDDKIELSSNLPFPLIIAITGFGSVSKGALEILELFPHQHVAVADLEKLQKPPTGWQHKIFITIFARGRIN